MKKGFAALVAVGVLALAGSAQAATYPDSNGSAFDADAEGWTSTLAECAPAGGTPLCTQENVQETGGGNGSGGLVARTTVLVNVLQLFRGESVWASPSFTAQAAQSSGVVSYERSFIDEGLADLAPRAVIDVVLVDDALGTEVRLGTEEITETGGGWATQQAAVPAESLRAGRRYHLELRSAVATTAAGLGIVGSAGIHYDNVALRTNNLKGSPGATVTGRTLTEEEFRRLVRSISLAAEIGRGVGGSLVPLESCTIIGTPGNDRITGSPGRDVICGLGGNDVVNGGGASDVIDGANGNDRLSGKAGGDVMVGLRGRDMLSGGAGKDGAGGGKGADRMRGQGQGDRLLGASGVDRLAGNAGADRLQGGRGNDRLNGGKGRDRMSGGAGRDRFAARDRNRDRVKGGSGRDRAAVDKRGLRLDVVGGVERR